MVNFLLNMLLLNIHSRYRQTDWCA